MPRFTGVEKTVIFVFRILQICFAAILIGSFIWFMHQFSRVHVHPTQVRLTIITSFIALITSFVSIIFLCFLKRRMMLFVALVDGAVTILYIVCAVLYRHNYKFLNRHMELRNMLIESRKAAGLRSDHLRIDALVRLGGACIIIQM